MVVLYKTKLTFENGKEIEFITNAATRQKLMALAKHYKAEFNQEDFLISEVTFAEVIQELDSFVADNVPDAFDFKQW
jgi:hypothetical protein